MNDETLSPAAAQAVHKATSAAQAVEMSRAEQINMALGRHEELIIGSLNENYTNIMTTLATLVAGQSATNTHLSILNGKVAEHEKSLSTLLLWKAEAKGFIGAINIGWTAVISLISGLGAYLLFRR